MLYSYGHKFLKLAGKLIPLHWTLTSQTFKSISDSLEGRLYKNSIHVVTKLLAIKKVLIFLSTQIFLMKQKKTKKHRADTSRC